MGIGFVEAMSEMCPHPRIASAGGRQGLLPVISLSVDEKRVFTGRAAGSSAGLQSLKLFADMADGDLSRPGLPACLLELP